ncbi:MAG: polysaccharide deacetylase family protein [Deltaproteobacteria bacterium]|nr:polysaccharide deacetylase family protein [Deltaproteobacteria bacterium]
MTSFSQIGKEYLRLASARVSRDQPALLIFLFHAIFTDREEIKKDLIAPQQRFTVADFARFVAYYHHHGYRFVGPAEVIQGLDPRGRYVMITFDDGYFNNTRVLPVLEKYRAPALFFITSDNTRSQHCYWWDVLYRQLRQAGRNRKQISRAMAAFFRQRHDEIEAKLLAAFGARAFTPRADTDRPLSAGELTAFARHPLVHIGNHTAHHAILTNYDPDGIEAEMRQCQAYLGRLLGEEPAAVAYPHGNCNEAVIQAAARLGFKLGITTRKQKNRLPLNAEPAARLALGRFTLWGTRPIANQCAIFRGNWNYR